MPDPQSPAEPSQAEDILWLQSEALAVLTELCPGRTITRGDDVWSVRVDALHVGLHNAYTESRRQKVARDHLREFLRTRFSALLIDPAPAAEETLADARARILPQFMPAHYVKLAPIVSFPFHEALDIGLVIDSAKTYRYLKRDDLERWQLTEAAVLKLAVANLDHRSRGIRVHYSGDGPEKFIAMETRDSFDAVRILIPRLQHFVAEHLGDPYHFAIPNRDFLICWAATNSDGFKRQVAGKVAQDFADQPYSLSPAIFRWAAGRIAHEP